MWAGSGVRSHATDTPHTVRVTRQEVFTVVETLSPPRTGEVSAPPAPPAAPRRRGPFVGLVASHAVSLIGNSFTQVAMPWFVLETTGSAALTGVTAFFGFLPLVLSAVFGGAVVDRFGQRRANIVADVASGVTVAMIPLLHLTVGIAFWQILVFVFLGAMLDAPGVAARRALLPDVAGRAGIGLERANSLFETVYSVGQLVGPPVAGLLIAASGAVSALWANAAAFAVSSLLIVFTVPRDAGATAGTAQSYGKQLMDGLRFVWGNALMRTLSLLFASCLFFVMPLYAVVMPALFREEYGNATYLGLLLAAEGGGGILGAMLYGVFGHRVSNRAVILGAFLLFSTGVTVYAFQPPFWTMLLVGLTTGLAVGPMGPISATVFQRQTPPEMLGRVFGANTSLTFAAAPLGVLLGGASLQWLGFPLTMGVIAAGSLLVTVFAFTNRALHALDDPALAGAGDTPPVG